MKTILGVISSLLIATIVAQELTIEHGDTDLCRASIVLDNQLQYCGFYGGLKQSQLNDASAVYTTTVDVRNTA